MSLFWSRKLLNPISKFSTITSTTCNAEGTQNAKTPQLPKILTPNLTEEECTKLAMSPKEPQISKHKHLSECQLTGALYPKKDLFWKPETEQSSFDVLLEGPTNFWRRIGGMDEVPQTVTSPSPCRINGARIPVIMEKGTAHYVDLPAFNPGDKLQLGKRECPSKPPGKDRAPKRDPDYIPDNCREGYFDPDYFEPQPAPTSDKKYKVRDKRYFEPHEVPKDRTVERGSKKGAGWRRKPNYDHQPCGPVTKTWDSDWRKKK